MRVLFGMILGASLTAGAAFLHDTWAAGPSTSGSNSSTVQQRPMVNWDVVNENWRVMSQRAREAWTAVSHKITS